MSNAERQKRYRDKQRKLQEARASAAGVTLVPDYGVERNAPAPPNATRVTVKGCNVPKCNAPAVVLDDPEFDMPANPVHLMCYGRPSVWCSEFDTRPKPLDPADQPVPMNRGRYKRADGTVYQFDSKGQHFECKHPYKDEQGKPHLAVYETVDDVRKAGGAWT